MRGMLLAAGLALGLLGSLLMGSAGAQTAGGYLGLAPSDATGGVAGALVQAVAPGGPAANADLRSGDVIVSVDGREIKGGDALRQYVGSQPPGHNLALGVVRQEGGKLTRLNKSVTLGRSPDAPQPVSQPKANAPQPAPVPISTKPVSRLPAINWTRITDETEHAYSVEVPNGWRMKTGVMRGSPVNYSFVTRILSPDVITYMFFGETELASRTVPPPAAVKYEGQSGRSSGGQINMWQHYIGGSQYARYYMQTQLAKLCSNVSNVAEEKAKSGPSDSPVTQVDDGSVSFTCQRGALAMKGYVFVQTHITGVRGGAQVWGVDFIFGFLTPVSRYDDTLAAALHLMKSVEINQVWQARQIDLARRNDEATKKAYANAEQTRLAINQTFSAIESNFTAMDDIVTGIGHYVDPNTKQPYDLDNAKPVKWMDAQGRIVGTNTDTPPGDPNAWSKLQAVK